MTPASALRDAIRLFDEWAKTTDRGSAEWASGYPRWGVIYDAVLRFVDGTPPDRWSDRDRADILHALTHDNDSEHLATELAARPPELFRVIAQSAQQGGQLDARWQIADQLGRLVSQAEWVEPMLLVFAVDRAEYVRRRALASLARIRSSHVEALAMRAWDDAESSQWTRMNVLWCLERTRSPALRSYLALAAEFDDATHLHDFARQIRHRQSSS